ncbi:MAG: alpha/beta fold hydrolase, partial [Deltaproteobacteria bacterium]
CGGSDEVLPPRADAGGPPRADAGRSETDAGDDGLPRSEPAACRFAIPPALGLTEGDDYACGDLAVRENRGAGTGVIRVHYLRVFGAAAGRAAIYLDGGPGGSGDSILAWLAYVPGLLDGLRAQGDFLVLAQRGTRYALPALDCEDLAECVDGVGAEVDLTAFNTAYNADDVDDLRAALGYEQLDVYGISYGSRLGLEVLRRHPDRVRSAWLGGLVPAQVDWMAAVPASFTSGLRALDAACAADAACAEAFGALEPALAASLDDLDDEPVAFDYGGMSYELDGSTWASLLFRALYARSAYAWLPLAIHDLAERRTDRVAELLAALLDRSGGGVSLGLYYAVVCGELFNPPDPDAPDRANAAVPAAIRSRFEGTWYAFADACDAWPKHDMAAALAAPVAFDGPVLLASGAIDPITPPAFGDLAAQTLAGATHVVFAGSGHGASLQTPCGNDMLVAFFADPSAPPATDCANSITIDFVIPGATARRAVPRQRIRAELRRAPMPPQVVDALRRARRSH